MQHVELNGMKRLATSKRKHREKFIMTISLIKNELNKSINFDERPPRALEKNANRQSLSDR